MRPRRRRPWTKRTVPPGTASAIGRQHRGNQRYWLATRGSREWRIPKGRRCRVTTRRWRSLPPNGRDQPEAAEDEDAKAG